MGLSKRRVGLNIRFLGNTVFKKYDFLLQTQVKSPSTWIWRAFCYMFARCSDKKVVIITDLGKAS